MHLGTVSHEFFRPLSVTFDFTAMAALVTHRAGLEKRRSGARG